VLAPAYWSLSDATTSTLQQCIKQTLDQVLVAMPLSYNSQIESLLLISLIVDLVCCEPLRRNGDPDSCCCTLAYLVG